MKTDSRIVVICALLSLAGCMAENSEADENVAMEMMNRVDPVVDMEMMTTTHAPTARELYLTTCAACHGATAEGSIRAPHIENVVSPYADYVVRHGRNEMGYPAPMPAFAELAQSDLEQILGWLLALPKPTEGPALFARFCENCHGVDGLGGRVDKSIAGEELAEIYEIVREGHGRDRYGDREEYMPAWHETALTDAELALIADHVANLAVPDGEEHDEHDD